MANELIINLPSFTYIKSPFNENLAPGILQVTVTGKQISHGHIGLTTGDTTLNKGNIATYGFVYFKNWDTTNNVQIGSDGTLYPIILLPTEYSIMRWNAAAIHAKAFAGTPLLEYWAVEA
jgi:hypothetical protein